MVNNTDNMDNSEKLKICHVNCQSLLSHLDEFRSYFLNAGYHIICMSETWLKPAIPGSMVALQGYVLFRHDRVGKQGGGIAFFLHNSLTASILTHSTDSYCRKPEYLIAEISVSNVAKILLAVVYRPPNCGYIQEFQNTYLDILVNFKHSIVLGDFNIDMSTDSYDTGQFCTFIESSNLFLVPYGATHHTRESSTFIDLCLIDDPDKLLDFGQRDVCFLSAHDLIDLVYNVKVPRQNKRLIHCRDFCNIDPQEFLTDLHSMDLSRLLLADTIDDKVEIFDSHLVDCLDRHALLRWRHFRKLPAPWLTTELREAMRERDKVRRIWRRRRDDANYNRYKALRNSVQIMVRAAKQAYYLRAFNNSPDTATVWHNLRHLGLVRTQREDPLPFDRGA